MMKNITGLILLLVLTSGCIYLKQLVGLGPQKPKLELTGVEIVGLSMSGLDMSLKFTAENPNEEELAFEKLVYQVTSGDYVLARGEHLPKLTLKPLKKSKLALPLSLDSDQVGKFIRQLLNNSGKGQVTVAGAGEFVTSLGNVAINFKENREISAFGK